MKLNLANSTTGCQKKLDEGCFRQRERMLKEADIAPESKMKELKAAFLEAAEKIDISLLEASLAQAVKAFSTLPVLMLSSFVDTLGSVLSGVPFLWDDIFKEPDWSKLFDVIDVSYIPEPVYIASVNWLNQQIPDDIARGFVLWTFSCIVNSGSWRKRGVPIQKSHVAMFVALAMVLRTRPRVFTNLLPSLRKKQLCYKGKGVTPITVWMISQASHRDLHVGLYSWAHNLVPLIPLVGSDTQSRDLILELVEKILEKPEAPTKLVEKPEWDGKLLIPPPSFAILMRCTLPATSAREEEVTKRFKKIYPLLKNVALAGASGSRAMKQVIEQGAPGREAMKQEAMKLVTQQIFMISLKMAAEGNPVLAEEATAIAILILDGNFDCWKHWASLCKENREASVALLKTLVEKWDDHSVKLSSSSLTHTLAPSLESKAKKLVTQQIFRISLRLAGEGNSVLAKEATSIAIWALTESVVCWKRWDYLYKENLEASVAILKTLVEKWKDQSLNLSSSSLTHTLARSPESKAKKLVTQKIFTLSLRLAGEGNSVLAKDAAAIAIWSLTQNVDCWKRWDYLYKENLEASVALLKKLVDEWKAHFLQLSCDTLRVSQTMKSFMLKNKKAITEGGANSSLYKEADNSCKVISWRLSRGSSCLKGTCITAVALVTAVAAVFNLREGDWF